MNQDGRRVALVTHYFSTHGGGVESVAFQIARRVAANDSLQVCWFASDCDEHPSAHPGLGYESMRCWNGLERSGLPWPMWGLGSLLRLRRGIAAASVVHLHDFIYFGNLAAFFFAGWHRKPVVITQHLGDIPYDSRVLTAVLKLVNRTIGRWVLSRSDQVVFYSEVVRTQFLKSTPFRTQPEFWPNGVDTREFSPVDDVARGAIRQRLANEPGRTVFLFIGRFVEKKGLPLLRRLIAEFNEIEWWVLGWGATSAELEPSTWGLPNMKLFFDKTGGILADLYRGADLLVLPSKGEGFPLVVQQAMACGTPAMISSATAAAVPNSRQYFLGCELDGTEGDFARACDVLRDALRTGALQRLRHVVADHARSEWSWDLTAERYGSLYRRLAGCGPADAPAPVQP